MMVLVEFPAGWTRTPGPALAEGNLRANDKTYLVISVETVDHEVRKGIPLDGRRNARNLAGANSFLAESTDRVVVDTGIDLGQVVATLAGVGDVDEYSCHG